MNTPLWDFDRADRLERLAACADLLRQALRRRRCDHLEMDDWRAVAHLDRRIAVAEARYKMLWTEARRERRGFRLVTCD